MDVTDQILQQGTLVYSASDNTNPGQLSSAKTLNYSKGGSLQKADNLNVSVIPYKINYKDEVGLFGAENYYLKVNCKITGDVVLQCFTEVGWSCAFAEGFARSFASGTVTYYPPDQPGTGNQNPIDTARFHLANAQGTPYVTNTFNNNSQVSVGDIIYLNQYQSDPQGDPVPPNTFNYTWYYRDQNNLFPNNFLAIPGATSSTYTITNAYFDKHIGCNITYVDQAGFNNAWDTGPVFVATDPNPSGALPDYDNARIVDEVDIPNWNPGELLPDKLPDLGLDAYISVELIRKDTGNRFIDSHVDYRLYTQTGHEHPHDKMYIKSTDSFYIGIHARNTKRFVYEFECRIGNEYRPLASIADPTEIMRTNDRPSY